MGTPHQGIAMARMATRLLETRSTLTPTNINLLQHLEAHSEKLQEMQDEYNGISSDFHTIYAYELLPTRLTAGISEWVGGVQYYYCSFFLFP